MPDKPSTGPIPLMEVHVRAEHAHRILTGFNRANPVLAVLWQQIDDSVSDVPVLAAHIARLAGELATTRLNRANLAAAGRASLEAWRDREPDPMSYLRDELAWQGFAGRLP